MYFLNFSFVLLNIFVALLLIKLIKMSIEAEDFPEDIMLSINSQEIDTEDKFNILTMGAINMSISEKSSSSLMGTEEHSTSSLNGQSSSGVSSHDKSSCLSSNDKFGHENKDINSKEPIQHNHKNNSYNNNHLWLSYQDLHSDYTKKKYKHVKSKVREYIQEIQEQDRLRKSKKRNRGHSLPVNFLPYDPSKNNKLEHNCNDTMANNNQSCNSNINVNEMLIENERKMSELKIMNEYLKTNLEEKRAKMARLERNSNATRIELMQLKEKEKRQQAENLSLNWKKYSPRKLFGMDKLNQNKVSIGVQANLVGSDSFLESPRKILDNSNLLVIEPIPLDFNIDSSNPNERSRSLRRRSNSNTILSKNDTKSDIYNNNNGENEIENSIGQLHTYQNIPLKSLPSSPEDLILSIKKPNKRHKLFKRQKWLWILGPCCKCVKRKRRTSDLGNYTQIPLSEDASDCPIE